MTFKQRFIEFWSNPRNIFWVGLVLTVGIVMMEFLHNGMENHIDYSDATRNFFNGVSSYTKEYVDAHGRYFIYTPVFCFLYAPFAFLPKLIGGLLWDIGCYCLFFFGIMKLPMQYEGKRAAMILYLLAFLGQSLFEFQYNTIVCAIFLLVYILLERGHNFWAVLLIMFSATTKVYGAVELALLFCYPRFWRNLGYAVACGIGFILLPATVLGFEGLTQWYVDWWAILDDHQNCTGPYFSLIWAEPTRFIVRPNERWFQIGILAVLAVLFLLCHKSWRDTDFKVGVLATLMCYIVIMSEAAEFCTYIIPASGIALWYFNRNTRTDDACVVSTGSRIDRILFWAFFILFGLMPIDIFCPTPLCMFVHTKLWIGVWLFAVLWVRVIYTTVAPCLKSLRK